MKTTIKGLIKQHLIKVCKAKTAIMRERVEAKPKRQFGKKKVEEAFAAMRQHCSTEYSESTFNALAILLDAPELNKAGFKLEQFGVIVLGSATSGQPYGINIPHIVTVASGGTTNRLFYTDGSHDCGCTFFANDEPRPATDAEVESCINNLNDKQWDMVMNKGSIFAPLVAEAMNSEIDILNLGDDTAKESGDEIETNGRRITMGEAKE